MSRAFFSESPSLRRLAWWSLLILIAGMPTAVEALEIKEIRWGFDGKVLRNRFNVVSILIDNPLPEPFDGELRLQKELGGGQSVDAPLVEPVFVGPFSTRWVQFYPFVGQSHEGFSLHEVTSKGRRGPTLSLPELKVGWPARVLIETSRLQVARGLPVRSLPDELFPPFVTATDGLQAVLLDGVPDWDEPRRTAFVEWLTLGGRVFVLQTAAQTWPDFPTGLGMLNGPLETTSYGSGIITRVAASRSALDKERLTQLFSSLPERRRTKIDGTTEVGSPLDLDDEDKSIGSGGYSDASDPLASGSFLGRLKQMTRPKHNWAVLHLLFWVYIGLVFPGCYLLGRKSADYRIVYGALLGIVMLFSLLFGYVGQRGYGEATAVNSIAVARSLGNGLADVSQWSNAFVTAGGDYRIEHTGSGTIYSTCNTSELVKGIIQNGAEAQFVTDIPPFSSREFSHRTRLTGVALPKFTAKDVSLQNDQLNGMTLEYEGELPAGAESFVVVHGPRFHAVTPAGQQLRVGSSIGTAMGYLRVTEFDNYQYQYPYMDAEDRPSVERYRQLFTPLMARSLNISRASDAEAFRLPPGMVRLFFFAPMTHPFFLKTSQLGRQEGWVLYAVDVPLGG